MDHESLRTASTYLNNLLLSRALLRNSEPLDFVKPSKESRASIINLVHDLILRSDRADDSREQTAVTIRALQTENARKQAELDRLVAKNEESRRLLAAAQAAERTAATEAKKAERNVKVLQEQNSRIKKDLAQFKTQCVNDVRKRDLELTRLKGHLQGQQRGNRVGMTAPSMSVRKTSAERNDRMDVSDPEYSLKQETTEFLTGLSQSLSDENDGLIGLLRESLGSMRGILGLEKVDSAVGSLAGSGEVGGNGKAMLHALPTSYDALAGEMEVVVEHMKTILTNPNFVPIEEVEVREEEIARLREGWEHMELRWRDVLVMMEGWLRRMDTGDTINIEDLRRGMGLVSPNGTRRRQQAAAGADESTLESDTSSISLPAINEASLVADSPEQQQRPTSSPKRKRDVLEPPEFFDLRPRSKDAASPRHRPLPEPPAEMEDDESEDLEIPQMTIQEKLTAVQEEAERAAAEQAEAKRTAQTSSQREKQASSRRAPPPSFGTDGAMDDEDTLGKMPGEVTLKIATASPMGKKTRIKGRPRKRKSTLLPDELEAIMGMANGDGDGDGF